MDMGTMFGKTNQLWILLFTSTMITLFSTIMFMLTNSMILLAASVVSSSVMILSAAAGVLWLSYYDKTYDINVKIGSCSIFNLTMMIIYFMFIVSFFLTVGGVINVFISDPLTQYLLYGTYSLVLLIIIILSILIIVVKRPNYNGLLVES